MRLKTLLLSTACLGLLSAPVFAQSGKPGQRLFNDERVPEAPQLQKRIFKEPRQIIQRESDKKQEEPPTADEAPEPNVDDADTEPAPNDEKNEDVIYRKDQSGSRGGSSKTDLSIVNMDGNGTTGNAGSSNSEPDDMKIIDGRRARGDFSDEEVKSKPTLEGDRLKEFNDQIKKQIEGKE